MPIIKKAAPLLPEGEYCGQARKVSLEWSKPKPLPNGAKSESVQMFRIPLHLPDGRLITTLARVTDSNGWVFEAILKSGELTPNEGEEFILTPDDLEGRRFYFGVKHEPWNGVTLANVRFHSKTYACQVNPSLEGMTFPNEAPRGVVLRAAKPAPSAEPPPETRGATAAANPQVPPQPGASAEAAGKPEDLTDEEYQSALEYARKLREGKGD